MQLKEVADLDATVASGTPQGVELLQNIEALEQTVNGMMQRQPDVGGFRRWMHLSLGTDRLGR